MDEIALNIGSNELLLIGKKRYIFEDLSVRDFDLENSTPFKIIINGYEINETSWGEVIRNLAAYLIMINDIPSDILLSFRTDRSKKPIFSFEKGTNYKKVNDNLYVNCNNTALHGCWMVQDLLKLFKVDLNNVKLLVHRPSSIEPKEVLEYFLRRTYAEFDTFLIEMYGKTSEQCEKIRINICKYLNPILKGMSNSYDNLFLFDDSPTLYNYVAKIREKIQKTDGISEKNKIVLIRLCKYLVEFYKL